MSLGRWRRHLSVFAALLVAVAAGPVVLFAAWRSTFAVLGRDPGIYQYVAWAIAHGERAYVDFREINGPLVYFIHLAFEPVARGDEHVFRVLDALVLGAAGAFAGAALPGMGGVRALATPARERAAWAAAGAVVMLAQYLILGWWHTAQRESFYVVFLLVAAGAQLRAHHRAAPASRGTRALLLLAGFASALPWFGKPTMVVFTVLQAGALLADDYGMPSRRARLAWLAGGAAAATVAMTAATWAIGDPWRGLRIILLEVPREYRFIWARRPLELYFLWRNGPKLNYALPTLALALALVYARVVPRRALTPAAMLAGGLVTFVAQQKGFPYHLHGALAGTHLVWLCLLACVVRRHRRRWWLGGAGAAAVAAMSIFYAASSDPMRAKWVARGRTAEQRDSAAYLDEFASNDYFPADLRAAGRFLRERTPEDARVQLYGMDPYVLYFARRRSATPFLYSFELDVDAAIAGGTGAEPSPADVDWLRGAARAHEDELVAGLERRAPAAFVFVDRMPFSFPASAVESFAEHCPRAHAWMAARYAPAADFRHVHVWLAK